MDANFNGQSLGPYRILEQIGKGGMATVYKAYEPSLDRYVAIKVLPEYFAHYPEFVSRFEREAKAIAKLDHPNIVPIFGYGQDRGLMYLVMRYVPAGTLREMMGRAMDLRVVGDILRQVGGALHYAHQQGVVHRDIKPSNVLMADRKWALLTDFGLAKMVESSSQLTKSGVGVGTPAYMSPEQGQGMNVDLRTDIYSLGVMLYEMTTGRIPYDAETPMAIVLKHISAPLPLPSAVNPNLPENVQRVILKAMAKEPDDRFQTVEEMVKAFDKALDEIPSSEQPTSFAELVKPADKVPQSRIQETLPQPPNLELPIPLPEHEKQTQVAAGQPEVRTIPEQRFPPAKTKIKRSIPVWVYLLVGFVLVAVVIGGLGFRRIRIALRASRQAATQKAVAATRITRTPVVVNQPTVKPVLLTSTPMPVEQAQLPFKPCLLTDEGGVEDRSFNQASWIGLQAADKLVGSQGTFLVSKSPEDYAPNLLSLLDQGCDLVISSGFLLGDATWKIAVERPERKFAIIDFTYPQILPNLRTSEFATDQAAFLAGYLAAGMTQTGKVGTYGGVQIDPVVAFMEGFTQGVFWYNQVHATQVVVLGWDPLNKTGLFSGNFVNQEDGRKLSEELFRQGVDIILPVAGPQGIGTLELMHERGSGLLIGVDTDWSLFFPDRQDVVLASVAKNISSFVTESVRMAKEGRFEGGNYRGDLANNGVGLVIGEGWRTKVPDSLKIELEKLGRDIIDGRVKTRP